MNNSHIDSNIDLLEDFDLTKSDTKIYPLPSNNNDSNISNEIVSDFQIASSHHNRGYNENNFVFSNEYDPHLSYLNQRGLIGKIKTRYIRKYFNINSKDRVQSKIIKEKDYTLKDNSLEIFNGYLLIHNISDEIKPNTKILISCEIDNNICLRSEFTNGNEIQKLFQIDSSDNKILIINDSCFNDYCGKIIIDGLLGDRIIKIFFINYDVIFDNNIITISDDIVFINIEIENDKVISYELFPNNPDIKDLVQEIVSNTFRKKLIILPSEIYEFLKAFDEVIPFIRQSIRSRISDYEIDKPLISDINITESNIYQGVPINIINDCHQINNNMICLDDEGEINSIDFDNDCLEYKQHQVSDISISYGNDINLDQKIFTISQIKNNIGIIDLKYPDKNNKNKFGSNILISTIKNMRYGFNNPSNYLYNFNTSIKDIVSIRMVESIFPRLKTFIKKSKLYYQTINDGNNINHIIIPEGLYSDGELENFINTSQTIFTIKINCNINLVQFNSDQKIRIRFDISDSIDLGFQNKTIFSKEIRNESKYISSIKKEKIKLDLFGFDYIMMEIVGLENIHDNNNKYFYKIQMKEQGNNNLNYCQNNKLYNTFVDTPILLNEPIREISKLNIKFYDPYHNEIYFDCDHSFTLEFITLNDIPHDTNIRTN